MKTVLLLSVAAIGLLLGTLGYVLVTQSTNELIIGAVTDSYRLIPKSTFIFYLKHMRRAGPDGANELSPLPFALNACYGRLAIDKNCTSVVDWLIDSRGEVDALSNDKFAFAPLHSAVLACSPDGVKYLLEKKADPNITARGAKFAGMTPLQLVDELSASCAKTQELSDLLTAHGGHR